MFWLVLRFLLLAGKTQCEGHLKAPVVLTLGQEARGSLVSTMLSRLGWWAGAEARAGS